MLDWLGRFNICCFLDNHGYDMPPQKVDCLGAAGSVRTLPADLPVLEAINAFTEDAGDWLFGHFSFELKQVTEGVANALPLKVPFSVADLFIPRYVLLLSDQSLSIGSLEEDHEEVWAMVSSMESKPSAAVQQIRVTPAITRETYTAIVRKLKEHIHRGDCYEMNFCQEFHAEQVQLEPLQVFRKLAALSPNPFSVYYRQGHNHLLCASPERFITRVGDELISQPIKGTIMRNREDAALDAALRETLRASAKDRTENVMIVDLVRNDLSKVCVEGSVQVPELFGIYAFPQVYQMISTVKGRLKEGMQLGDVLKACFPMGSMTGAPKRRVLELTEQYERVARGLFSGSVGYITPQGNYDFNVVIRSILYNDASGYLQFLAGSGITAASDPDQEYEECLLKAAVLQLAISG